MLEGTDSLSKFGQGLFDPHANAYLRYLGAISFLGNTVESEYSAKGEKHVRKGTYYLFNRITPNG